jgi:pyruvate/2-oxoglutarate dehydrogenase complex dihydrolipoamide acyltransferase (E2) component
LTCFFVDVIVPNEGACYEGAFMPIEILMPALSPTMKEGRLLQWMVAEGDAVSPGDILGEIETDKAVMEIEAIDEGVVGKLVVPAGTDGIEVNKVIAILLDEGESLKDIENMNNASGVKKEKSSESQNVAGSGVEKSAD